MLGLDPAALHVHEARNVHLTDSSLSSESQEPSPAVPLASCGDLPAAQVAEVSEDDRQLFNTPGAIRFCLMLQLLLYGLNGFRSQQIGQDALVQDLREQLSVHGQGLDLALSARRVPLVHGLGHIVG